MKLILPLLAVLLTFSNSLSATEKTTIRIGVLPFGTVNWELTALQYAGLDNTDSYSLAIRQIANPQAGKIALQSGAVDMVVSDWIWVSRQRAHGSDLSFFPYSNTAGALIVAADSPIHTLPDIQGRSLGIAGGELDKNWLLLQALAEKNYHINLNTQVEKLFAAAPLLNQQLLHHRVDAIINYWHFAARLEAQGYRQIINGSEILQQLGITEKVPSLGYVFKRNWAQQNRQAINSFLKAAQQSGDSLCDSNEMWQKILPLTRTEHAATQKILRKRYCAGRITQWGEQERQAAGKIYALLRKYSKNRLTGDAKVVQAGTFWIMEASE